MIQKLELIILILFSQNMVLLLPMMDVVLKLAHPCLGREGMLLMLQWQPHCVSVLLILWQVGLEVEPS